MVNTLVTRAAFLSLSDFLIIQLNFEVRKLNSPAIRQALSLTLSIFLEFGKGSLITPQGSKQTTLTDVQITSKQPSMGGKQMTKEGRGEAPERLGLPAAILK